MKNMRGWSLVEVLVVMVVAAVAGGLLINLMVSSNQLFFDQSAQINHGLSLNQAEPELTDLIKSAVSPAAQYPAQGTAQYTADSDTLIIKLPALSVSGDIIDFVYDYAVVEADVVHPNVLRKQVFKDNQSFRKSENRVLLTNLSSVTFSYLDIKDNPASPNLAERVGFSISVSTKSGLSENVDSISRTVNIKNL